MATARALPALGLALLIPTLVAPCALADGDDFFAYQARTVLANGKRTPVKNGFFGSVRDADGHLLPDVQVKIAIKVETDQGPRELTYGAYTNLVGRYRSMDAGSVVAAFWGFIPQLKPSDVVIVGAEKEGYVEERRLGRSKPGAAVQEVDIVMKKAS